MAELITVNAEERKTTGSGAARRLRRAGLVPGVVYGDKGQSRTIQLNRHDFEMMLHRHRTENLIVDLVIGGGPVVKALLREVQRHPVTGALLHVDFWEISMSRRMRLPVRIELRGEPAGVQAGGILQQLIREIEVECLPQDLMESIVVDVSALKMGEHVLVKDLQVSAKWHVLTAPEIVVAAVIAPRLEAEEKPEAEAQVAEPEVITEAQRREREEAAREAEEEGGEESKAGEKGKHGEGR